MNHIGVFAKFWEPGRVKTRLAKTVGHKNASRLYQHFLQHILLNCSPLAASKSLWFWPPERRTDFEQMLGRHRIEDQWQLSAQSDGDLGVRMRKFFAHSLNSSPGNSSPKVILIGSDSPQLPRQVYQEAFVALESYDVVIGPSSDGGYYLIGMRQTFDNLFCDIPWSTQRVLSHTQQRLEQLGVGFHLLPVGVDVDEIEDLWQIRKELMKHSQLTTLDESLLKKINATLAECGHECD